MILVVGGSSGGSDAGEHEAFGIGAAVGGASNVDGDSTDRAGVNREGANSVRCRAAAAGSGVQFGAGSEGHDGSIGSTLRCRAKITFLGCAGIRS